MRVTAAVARAYGQPLALESLEIAAPGPGEVLVRLVAAGVGAADKDAVAGLLGMPLPFVPGSEAAGIVERVGAGVTDLEPGDSVFVDYAACGHCEACRRGRPRECTEFHALNLSARAERPVLRKPTGEVHGGFFGQSSFATHLVCAAASVVRLPPETPLEIAAALGGEIATGVAAITDAFRLRPGDTLAILGAGPGALAACLIARDRGAQAIIVADPYEERRHLASRCGATIAVHADEELETAVKSLVGEGASFALETTGRETAFRACLDSLRPGGTLGVTEPVWRTASAVPVKTSALVLPVDRLVAPRVTVADLIDLHLDGRFPIDRLITYFPLAKINEALDALDDGSASKPVLRFPVGAFDDLDRARSGGAVNEVPDPAPPVPAPGEKVR